MRTLFKLAVGITALFAVPILRADLMQTDNVVVILTLTEVSSTSLVVTSYTGTGGISSFTVTPNGTDNWTVSIVSNLYSPSTFFFSDFIADFQEPAPEVNEVNEAYSGDTVATHQSFTVESDESLATYQGQFSTMFPNGGTTTYSIGSDNGRPIFLQFFDNATASETASGVADTGSSLAFLALSVAGLGALSRSRRFRWPNPFT